MFKLGGPIDEALQYLYRYRDNVAAIRGIVEVLSYSHLSGDGGVLTSTLGTWEGKVWFSC